MVVKWLLLFYYYLIQSFFFSNYHDAGGDYDDAACDLPDGQTFVDDEKGTDGGYYRKEIQVHTGDGGTKMLDSQYLQIESDADAKDTDVKNFNNQYGIH